MAPVKRETQQRRIDAAKRVGDYLMQLDAGVPRGLLPALLEALPEVKGLYGRALLRDQWDWFTVWTQLGYPPAREMRACRAALGDLRRGLRSSDVKQIQSARRTLMGHGSPRHLRSLRGRVAPSVADGTGFVYILSTREAPNILKIGYTTKSVRERVEQINAATGILTPFGARAVWRFKEPAAAERQVHALLAPYRVRPDREFFRIEFREAVRLIDEEFGPSTI